MQNFRTKARASSGIFSGKKVAACMLSVAVAAVIFWGITLTGNTEHSDEQMTVAQALRAAGDTLSVYPGQDGKALYSLHAVQFYEALQDMRALELLGEKIGRDAVNALIDEDCAEPLGFFKYPREEDYILKLREKVNAML